MQKFDPEKVMLSNSLNQEIVNEAFTAEFLEQLVQQSKVVQLGERVEMGNQKIKRFSAGAGELTDAYFVGEGEKIGVAKVEGTDYTIEAKKIAVILPVTEEFLSYTWANYFQEVVPLIADKFNRMIDGAAFLGLHGNPFETNVLAEATSAGNVIEGALDAETILDLEALPSRHPNAFVGNRGLNRDLRRLNAVKVDGSESIEFQGALKPTEAGVLDGLPYHELLLADGAEYPAGTLITGNFNGLKYGIPQGTNLRLALSDQATLSKVKNASPDSGDVHLFEQDMRALRAVFEIGVAVPNGATFAVLDGAGVEA